MYALIAYYTLLRIFQWGRVDDMWYPSLLFNYCVIRLGLQAEPYKYRRARPNEFSLHNGVCNTRHSRTFLFVLRPAVDVRIGTLCSYELSIPRNLTK